MAVLFALIALVGWGAGDIVVTIVSRKIGNRNAYFWWAAASLLLAGLYIPFAGPIRNWLGFITAILLNIFSFFGTLLYFQALEFGNASLVGTIAGAFPLVTVPLSIILFAEKLNQLQVIAIVLTLSGLILATLHWDEIKKRDFQRLMGDKNIHYAFITLIIWGIYWALVRVPVEKIGWYWSLYPGYLTFIFLPMFKLVKSIPFKYLRKMNILWMIIFMSGLTAVASFSYNLGITYGYTSIIAPIAGSSPVLFVILSRFVFREPLTRQQKAGIGLSLLGIVAIGISSV